MLSLNLSGSHWLKYGEPRDNLISLQAVLSSGEIVNFDSASNVAGLNTQSDQTAKGLVQRVGKLLDQRSDLIEQHRPQVQQNQSGYNLFDLKPGNRVDLTRLLVGSEGTLGAITQATLQTEPIPRFRGAVSYTHLTLPTIYSV